MQLSDKHKLTKALAGATAALLAVNAHAKEAWDIDAEALFYQEGDDRVQDVSFKSLASRPFKDEDKLTLSLQFDSLTGASPNGAMRQNEIQTFTQASGGGEFSVPAQSLPLDDSFKDTRLALGASYLRNLDSGARFTYGATFSKEYDYLHLGASTSYAFNFDNQNRTLSVGVGVASDTIEPVGGVPTANSLMLGAGNTIDNRKQESKTVLDVLFGFTQIINRRSLVQFNYSASVFSGYLNDPYKIVSVLGDDGAALELANGSGNLYRYESRPDTRVGHNLYVEYKYRFDKSIVNLSYRYHTDDWGINSHTVETRYRWLIDAKQWLEPNLRYYTQTAADFYTPWVLDSNLPQQASADYRLAEFSGVTLGLSYKRKLGKDTTIGFSFESYKTSGPGQSITVPSGDVVDTQYTDLQASIFRANYSFKW